MKANKVTVKIEMEALSIDCLRHLVERALIQIEGEFENGELCADDGDEVRWHTSRKLVEF